MILESLDLTKPVVLLEVPIRQNTWASFLAIQYMGRTEVTTPTNFSAQILVLQFLTTICTTQILAMKCKAVFKSFATRPRVGTVEVTHGKNLRLYSIAKFRQMCLGFFVQESSLAEKEILFKASDGHRNFRSTYTMKASFSGSLTCFYVPFWLDTFRNTQLLSSCSDPYQPTPLTTRISDFAPLVAMGVPITAQVLCQSRSDHVVTARSVSVWPSLLQTKTIKQISGWGQNVDLWIWNNVFFFFLCWTNSWFLVWLGNQDHPKEEPLVHQQLFGDLWDPLALRLLSFCYSVGHQMRFFFRSMKALQLLGWLGGRVTTVVLMWKWKTWHDDFLIYI